MRKLLILTLAALTGCYSYVPAAQEALGHGAAVRARLSAPTDFRLTELSVNNTILVNGEVVSHDPEALVLSAFSLRSQTGFDVPAAGETLVIPTERIEQVQRRKLDVLRSAALAAAGLIAGTLLFAAFDSGGEGGGSGGGRPRPQ